MLSAMPPMPAGASFEANDETMERFWRWVAEQEILEQEEITAARSNPVARADVARALRIEILNATQGLEAGYRVAMTGTPVENNVGDLWSVMEYLNPGFLGSQQEYRRKFFIPIQAMRDEGTLRQVLRQIAGVDTLVLGCTHYPFVLPLLRRITGPEVTIIDPAPAVARQVQRQLAARNWLVEEETRQPEHQFFASGTTPDFADLLAALATN